MATKRKAAKGATKAAKKAKKAAKFFTSWARSARAKARW